jgi:nucleoid DNA-binding protein
MDRRELILAMARLALDPAFRAREHYESTLGSLPERLGIAGGVDVPGLGTFRASCTSKPARTVVNPFTKATSRIIPARRIAQIRFVPAPSLLARINASFEQAGDPGPGDPLELAFAEGLMSGPFQVQLADVGRFFVRKIPARKGPIDPKTGERGPAIASHRTVAFSSSGRLRARIAADPAEDEGDF